MKIDLKLYRDANGLLDSFGYRLLGQKIQIYVNERGLTVQETFRELILPMLKDNSDDLDYFTIRELIFVAAQCGPETTHNYTDAIVLLYRVLGLTPENARKELLKLFEKACINMANRINRIAFYDAEFYLGLKRGTLYNFNEWK